MNEKRVTPALCASLGNGERGAFTDRTTVSAAGRAPAMGACAYDGNDARPRTKSERAIMDGMVVASCECGYDTESPPSPKLACANATRQHAGGHAGNLPIDNTEARTHSIPDSQPPRGGKHVHDRSLASAAQPPADHRHRTRSSAHRHRGVETRRLPRACGARVFRWRRAECASRLSHG